MNKINILKVFLVVLLVLFIYFKFCKKPLEIFLSNKTLPKTVMSYKSLSKKPLIYENYEMIPFLSDNKDFVIKNIKEFQLYDDITKNNYIIGVDLKRRSELLSSKVYWKLNDQGTIIDSITIDDDIRLFNSGVFFEKNYYIDWFNTGDKIKKTYITSIDDEDLLLDEVKNYINTAKKVDIGVDYSDFENKKFEIFLFDGSKWSLLKSKKLYNEVVPKEKEQGHLSKDRSKLFEMKDSNTFSINLEGVLSGYKKRFYSFNNVYYSSQEKEQFAINIEAFEKKSYFKKPFFSLADYGNSGWYGNGFITLQSKSISFPFKIEAFKPDVGGIRTGIDLIYPTNEISEKFIFVNVGNKKNREEPKDYYGLYILRDKTLTE